MADYVSCPACHGKGLIPLEQAARIEVHDTANWEAKRREQAERDEADRKQRAEENRGEVLRRVNARRERHERQLQVAVSAPEHTPEQLTALQARLARLEARREQDEAQL